MSEDLLGEKSKKEKKRDTLRKNKRNGKSQEEFERMMNEVKGKKVTRKRKGSDWEVCEIDLETGEEECHLEEVKSGNATLSEKQKERKDEVGEENYEVKRGNSPYGGIY